MMEYQRSLVIYRRPQLSYQRSRPIYQRSLITYRRIRTFDTITFTKKNPEETSPPQDFTLTQTAIPAAYCSTSYLPDSQAHIPPA